MLGIAPFLLYWVMRLLRATCRVHRVEGVEHLDGLLTDGHSPIPCSWHQRLFYVVLYLLERRASDFEPGFLVSPSRDGELVSRTVGHFGATMVRGSATRTGAKALRELYTVVKSGVSPISHPDGPTGPPFQCKPGSVLLAQITGEPLLPMAFAADRYWQLGSWDRLIVPKPFARITLILGEPIHVGKKEDLTEAGQRLGQALNAVTATADDTARKR